METYNDLLTRFANCYVEWEREAVLKAIKYSFKKLTKMSINDEVSDYNYQWVIDSLSNAKIPHCTFAEWLRKQKQQPTTLVTVEPVSNEKAEELAAAVKDGLFNYTETK